MTRRVPIEAWGNKKHHLFKHNVFEGKYAIKRKSCETAYEAVARSIERRTGYEWCSLRPDGRREDEYYYVGTLGSSLGPGEGWIPEVEIWFSIHETW